jgi:hypothetical protein
MASSGYSPGSGSGSFGPLRLYGEVYRLRTERSTSKRVPIFKLLMEKVISKWEPALIIFFACSVLILSGAYYLSGISPKPQKGLGYLEALDLVFNE